MFRSVFLRKMIFMVLVALCASALLSATLFRYAANAVTKQNEETLLIEKAHALSDFLNTHLQQEETTNFADASMSLKNATLGYSDHSVLGAYFLLYNPNAHRRGSRPGPHAHFGDRSVCPEQHAE